MNTNHSELPTISGFTNELQKLLVTPELNLMNMPMPSKDMFNPQMPIFPMSSDTNLALFQLQMSMGIIPMMPSMQPFLIPLMPPPAMDLSNMFNNSLIMKIPPTSVANASINMSEPSKPSPSSINVPLPVSSPETKRKRSRASAEPQVSILRQLCEEDDVEVIKIKKMDDNNTSRLRTQSLCLKKKPEVEQVVPSSKDSKPLRRIIRDQDLPETVGPDSPYRHHPKYQNRKQDPKDEMFKEFETITAIMMVNGIMPKELQEKFNDNEREKSQSPKEAPFANTKTADESYSKGDYTKSQKNECPMQEFMEQVISRELVICE